MRKLAICLVAISLWFSASLVFGVQAVEAAYTPDGGGFPLCSGIDINSPGNNTYPYNSLTLSVSVRGMLTPQFYTYTLVYSIDGGANATIPVTSTFVPVMATRNYANGTTENIVSSFASYYRISGCAALSELPLGSHTLTIYARYDRFNDANTNWPKLLLDESTVGFTVSAIAAFSDTVTDPPAVSNSTTPSTPAGLNGTSSTLEPSETNVDSSQLSTTWQAGTSYTVTGVLVVGIIVSIIVIFAKRKRKTAQVAPLSPQKIRT